MLVGAAILLLGAAACGGGGDRTFEARGIGITFTYPSSSKPATDISFARRAGASAAARAGVALDKNNLIVVSRCDLKRAITAANLPRFKGEVDTVIGQLAGKPVSGRQVEYGGLPGYEYAIALSTPPNSISRMAVLFAQATEYLINCQSTPPERDEIEKACRKALDTLERA